MTLSEDLEALRNIPAKWKGLYDPQDDCRRIRDGDDQSESSEHFYNCEVCGEHSHCLVYTRLVVKEQVHKSATTECTALDKENAELRQALGQLIDACKFVEILNADTLTAMRIVLMRAEAVLTATK